MGTKPSLLLTQSSLSPQPPSHALSCSLWPSGPLVVSTMYLQCWAQHPPTHALHGAGNPGAAGLHSNSNKSNNKHKKNKNNKDKGKGKSLFRSKPLLRLEGGRRVRETRLGARNRRRLLSISRAAPAD